MNNIDGPGSLLEEAKRLRAEADAEDGSDDAARAFRGHMRGKAEGIEFAVRVIANGLGVSSRESDDKPGMGERR